MRAVLIVSLCAALLSAASPVEIWTAGELTSSAGTLTAEANSTGIAGKTLAAWASGSASLWRRAKSGQAELHRTKADLIVIEQGAATLVFGGTIEGEKNTAPNEVRGTSIQGGESRQLAPGDVIRIPAGTPHQFVLSKGQSVAYVAVKIAAR